MTMEQLKLAKEGRGYWFQYARLNGFAMEPTSRGLKALSRNIDISVSRLRKCIYLYLEA